MDIDAYEALQRIIKRLGLIDQASQLVELQGIEPTLREREPFRVTVPVGYTDVSKEIHAIQSRRKESLPVGDYNDFSLDIFQYSPMSHICQSRGRRGREKREKWKLINEELITYEHLNTMMFVDNYLKQHGR